MSSNWNLILQDGSSHPVTGHISFEIIGSQKYLKGSLEVTPAVFDAFRQGECTLESSGGHRHKMIVERIQGADAMIRGTM